MVAMSSPSTLSHACMACPVSASGSPDAKPSSVTTINRCAAAKRSEAVAGAAAVGTLDIRAILGRGCRGGRMAGQAGTDLCNQLLRRHRAAQVALGAELDGLSCGGVVPVRGRDEDERDV